MIRRALLCAALLGGCLAGGAAQAAKPHCDTPVLVLSAMPVELDPLLAATTSRTTVTYAGHDFYLGRLRGQAVALSLTGIGPVNATRVTRIALSSFRCGSRSSLRAVVFSGVAGGDQIGNVAVPTAWTLDAGKHVIPADARLVAAARRTARTHVALERQAPAGDPACGCVISPDEVSTVAVTTTPHVEIGGTGQTTDPVSGKALPCVPGGGDVLGCAPCLVQEQAQRDAPALVSGASAFVDPAFFAGYSTPVEDSKHYVVEDEETAAGATHTAARRVPFLGIRAVSDGAGDPLGLPGFPVQFFYYRQLAADNAARLTLAVLAHL
jgi:nucleoside phosphorylase